MNRSRDYTEATARPNEAWTLVASKTMERAKCHKTTSLRERLCSGRGGE